MDAGIHSLPGSRAFRTTVTKRDGERLCESSPRVNGSRDQTSMCAHRVAPSRPAGTGPNHRRERHSTRPKPRPSRHDQRIPIQTHSAVVAGLGAPSSSAANRPRPPLARAILDPATASRATRETSGACPPAGNPRRGKQTNNHPTTAPHKPPHHGHRPTTSAQESTTSPPAPRPTHPHRVTLALVAHSFAVPGRAHQPSPASALGPRPMPQAPVAREGAKKSGLSQAQTGTRC